MALTGVVNEQAEKKFQRDKAKREGYVITTKPEKSEDPKSESKSQPLRGHV